MVQMLTLWDPANILCPQTGAPIVVIDAAAQSTICALPLEFAGFPVRLVHIPRTDLDDPQERDRVNWWICGGGNCYYDEESRFEFLKRHNCLVV